MELRRHRDADSFLSAASPLLLRDEARHNLIFGICTSLVKAPATYREFYLWTVEADGEHAGAAVMTPPFNLILAQPSAPGVLEFLAEELHGSGREIVGVTGALPESDRFASAWERRAGRRRRRRMVQGIYRVSRPVPPDGVEGRLRLATAGDRPLLVEWTEVMMAEAFPPDAPHGDAAALVDRRLASSGGFAIWEHDEPVSFAGYGGETPHGLRIGPVYTPPSRRERGYASALVAQLSQRLLAEGRDYCFLYTDLSNPTSNRIYANVGYEFVCESVDYAFDKTLS
jgi:uncharacterized protein